MLLQNEVRFRCNHWKSKSKKAVKQFRLTGCMLRQWVYQTIDWRIPTKT